MSERTMTTQNKAFDQIYLVGRKVFLETLRRKDLYVLLILAGIFVLGILVVTLVGVENDSTANFLLNLGMTLAWFFAHVLVLLGAVRQIPDEIENKTIYPLLAKPLKRSRFILGKWLALTLAGVIVLFVMLALGWGAPPKVFEYNNLLLLQVILLYIISLLMLAALALLFSLFLPKAVNSIVLAVIVFTGEKILRFVENRARGSVLNDVIQWISGYIPNFAMLNLTTRYTDGMGPVPVSEFVAVILMSGVYTFFALTLSIYVFRRRNL